MFLPAEIIKKKRNNLPLTEEEINTFVIKYTKGDLPDYQMAAFLMAVYFNGMTPEETLFLTRSMLNSGSKVDFSHLKIAKIDKHSTGGVGDKTSLILGPIVAAAGVAVPMISGRGLGHTGGTLDKLESIPGFSTQLDLDKFGEYIKKYGICLIGQTKEICPADKKIYALRDVTATVENLSLICASIMSKKLAEGIDGLVLDVKFGSGAFMKTLDQAEALAKGLMSIAKGDNKKVAALLTNMEQPLGRFAGNSLEIEECVSIMKNEKYIGPDGYDMYQDTRELSLELSAYMLWLGGAASSEKEGYQIAEKMLTSGKALQKFEEIVTAQGGRLVELPMHKNGSPVLSEADGYIESMQTESIGVCGILLGAGRAQSSDVIEPTAGIEFHKKVGDPIKKGEPIYTLYGKYSERFAEVSKKLLGATKISLKKIEKGVLIKKRLL